MSLFERQDIPVFPFLWTQCLSIWLENENLHNIEGCVIKSQLSIVEGLIEMRTPVYVDIPASFQAGLKAMRQIICQKNKKLENRK